MKRIQYYLELKPVKMYTTLFGIIACETYTILFEIISYNPSMYTKDHPKLIVSKEELLCT